VIPDSKDINDREKLLSTITFKRWSSMRNKKNISLIKHISDDISSGDISSDDISSDDISSDDISSDDISSGDISSGDISSDNISSDDISSDDISSDDISSGDITSDDISKNGIDDYDKYNSLFIRRINNQLPFTLPDIPSINDKEEGSELCNKKFLHDIYLQSQNIVPFLNENDNKNENEINEDIEKNIHINDIDTNSKNKMYEMIGNKNITIDEILQDMCNTTGNNDSDDNIELDVLTDIYLEH
jgi:hypothetical protein